MVLIEQKVTYKDIKEEYEESVLWVEQRVLGLWVFMSIFFTDILIYESNGATVVRNLCLEYFGMIPTFFQIWMIWYFLLVLTAVVIFTLFDLIFDIIYRIKPEWW